MIMNPASRAPYSPIEYLYLYLYLRRKSKLSANQSKPTWEDRIASVHAVQTTISDSKSVSQVQGPGPGVVVWCPSTITVITCVRLHDHFGSSTFIHYPQIDAAHWVIVGCVPFSSRAMAHAAPCLSS